MKLAIVRQKYTPYGGAERFVERSLAGLRSQGVEVTVIAREWAGGDGNGASGFLKVDPFYLGRTWRDVGFSHHVQRIVAEGRFDLVQSHERIPGCHIFRAGDGVHATWLELRNKARGAYAGIARFLTGRSPWHSYVLETEDAMFRHPGLRAVICNSRMVRDDIARRFDMAPEKLHVIPNGVDLETFHPGLRDAHRQRVRADLGIPQDAPVILFVGSGFERKGVHVLLRAFAAMENKEAHLVVVGKDRSQDTASMLAQTLDIDERVHFLGPREDVRPYYGAADLFCLPTLYDPMPNAALEALACGLPVITSTTCGAAELIEEGKNGFVCDALDVAKVSRHMATLCDSGLAAGMKEAARCSVERLDLAAMAQAMTDLYRQLPPKSALVSSARRALAETGGRATVFRHEGLLRVAKAPGSGRSLLRAALLMLASNVAFGKSAPLASLRLSGGAKRLEYEAGRIASLRDAGEAVPEILAFEGDCMVLDHVGEILELQLHSMPAADRIATLESGIDDLVRFHRAGHWHGASQIKNIVLRDGRFIRIDFEEDVGEALTRDVACAYDIVLFVNSSTLLSGMSDEFSTDLAERLLRRYLDAMPGSGVREALARARPVLAMACTLLSPLRNLRGRSLRRAFLLRDALDRVQ